MKKPIFKTPIEPNLFETPIDNSLMPPYNPKPKDSEISGSIDRERLNLRSISQPVFDLRARSLLSQILYELKIIKKENMAKSKKRKKIDLNFRIMDAVYIAKTIKELKVDISVDMANYQTKPTNNGLEILDMLVERIADGYLDPEEKIEFKNLCQPIENKENK
tara:strand:- start:5608 stop:6096 length:489 start_codon:yes stop_codon:yes gene_type:complete